MSSNPPSDLAYRVLRLERQLESYQRLHAEELEEIRRAVEQLKEQLLKDEEGRLKADEPMS
ncbi:MAG: hypothetical protein M1132_08180 [Chloroflexi bacterium]|nr:hypothetical protein [Chloroflexota bacterium]